MRYILTLAPIGTIPNPKWTLSELKSSALTEIALPGHPEYTKPITEECIQAQKAVGIRVRRDFAYELPTTSIKALDVFDPLPSLTMRDWHTRNPEKNNGVLSGKALFCLIKLGWLSMSEVAKRVHVREYTALTI
jgi:hypothetical protein